jgi:hypothetical protein
VVSCYLRHMKDVLDEAGIVVTPSNRKQIDQAVHQAVGVVYKDCPATWRQVKENLNDAGKRKDLVEQLQAAIR